MTDFLAQFSQFHFLRPDWFWVLIPLTLFWLLKLKMVTTTQWHQVIPPHLANAMLGNNKQNKIKQKKWFVPYIWLLTVIALAGPTWEKVEKPVFQVKRASVIILDMSMSMRATDIKPNRLSKARYKAIDLANAIKDGEVALVAYAGDAFTISPLTPDTRNITALIPSLKPEIMPVQGSYPLLGLTKATELLQQAGYPNGDIYWITDGVDNEDLPELTSFAGQTPYRINIMTVGTAEGAPIKMLDNSLLKDHLGSIVIPKLNNRDLMSFSNTSNGVFVNTTATDADIRTLLAATASRPQEQKNKDDTESNVNQSNDKNSLTGDDWQEFGPYIILLILPLVLTFFRKGAVILMMLILPFAFTPNNAMAADNAPLPSTIADTETVPTTVKSSWLDHAFKTKDQIGAELFNNQQFEQAAESFENSQWKGASAYKAGEYESALNYFSQDNSAQGLYNQGNTLANLNKLDEAIKAYEESLKLDPNNENALANKKVLEQLKQQQDQQQKQENEQQKNPDGEQDKDQKNSQDQQSEDGSDQESKNKPDQESNNDSDQQNSDSQDSNSSDSQSEQSPEPTPSEEQETPEQQNSQNASEQNSEQENKESDAQNEGQSEEQDKETEQETQATQAQLSQEQIENQEQEQKLQQLLRKVSDDPATLLRNKMILESKKRQQTRSPKGATKSW